MGNTNSTTNVTFSLFGWLVIILAFYFWSKTSEGYNIIYYGLILILMFLLFTQAKRITADMVVQTGQ